MISKQIYYSRCKIIRGKIGPTVGVCIYCIHCVDGLYYAIYHHHHVKFVFTLSIHFPFKNVT